MEIEHIIGFNLALLAAIVSPGPGLLYLLTSTLRNGRASGFAASCGLALAASTWTFLALLGLDGLFQLFPWAYTTFKIVGAAYLFYVAWSIWRGAKVPISETPGTSTRAFLGGVLVNAANPKAVLFAAAVLVVIFPPDLSLAQKMIVVGNHLVVEIIVYSGIAFIISAKTVSRRYLSAKPALDRIAATLLGGLGVRLILDR